MKTLTWYLHLDSNFDEILESLEGYELDALANDTLAHEIENRFNEVEFNVDFDETTGKIVSIKMKENNGKKLY